MHVVCHQNVGMDVAVEAGSVFAKALKVGVVVDFTKEAWASIDSALNHVLRDVGEIQAVRASHAASISSLA